MAFFAPPHPRSPPALFLATLSLSPHKVHGEKKSARRFFLSKKKMEKKGLFAYFLCEKRLLPAAQKGGLFVFKPPLPSKSVHTRILRIHLKSPSPLFLAKSEDA